MRIVFVVKMGVRRTLAAAATSAEVSPPRAEAPHSPASSFSSAPLSHCRSAATAALVLSLADASLSCAVPR